ncbi:MAG: hypothetical protein C4526_08135 [Nitrospiraceae bacterium]|nr:MAG: hypothetical protein C4526_08135 [Nitrospiraceae bacterium]
MQVKLNIFQRTVLLWNEIHPYNAVHVVEMKGPLRVAQLKNVIDRLLEKLGLVNLVIDRSRKLYEYKGGRSDVEITVVKSNEPSSALSREIRKHLNLSFATTGGITPFRFFAIPKESGFYLGLVYFHLIAGADSIIPLIKNLVSFYAEGKMPETSPLFILYPKAYGNMMPFNLKYLAGWLLTFPEHVSHMRKSFRPVYRDHNDTGIGFSCFSIQPSQYHSIIRAAKEWELTVNDLFLAILLKSVAPLASERLRAARRKHISLASIINVRKDLSVDAGVFGLFLSYFNVTHSVSEGIELRQLARDVRLQTMKTKKYKLFLRTIFEMRGALILARGLFRNRKKIFYSKYNPVWGGITNVNLNTVWPSSGGEVPGFYLRAVSTGQATPLVFSFTTVNDMITIGASYRHTVFSEADVEKILSDFSKCLSEITH